MPKAAITGFNLKEALQLSTLVPLAAITGGNYKKTPDSRHIKDKIKPGEETNENTNDALNMKDKITSTSIVSFISPTKLTECAGNKTHMIQKNKKDRKVTKAQPQLKVRHTIKDVPTPKTYDIDGRVDAIKAMSEDNEQVDTNSDNKPPCHNNEAKALKEGAKRKCSHCTQRTATINAGKHKSD